MISTKIVKIDPVNPQEEYLKEAAELIKNGGLVIIPTETVYGIAANMLNKKTIDRLYAIKGRPKDKPFSVHINTKEKIREFASDVPVYAWKLIDKFWPGPLTIILKAKNKGSIGTSILLSANGERSRTIGLRMPDSEIALKIITLSGVPVVCPSANLSNHPAAANFAEAMKDMQGRVDFAIDSGSTRLGIESSVIDLTQNTFPVLREAAIKKDEIYDTLFKKTVLFICTGNSCRSVMAKAILEKKLEERNRQDLEVLSAGIMLLSGLGATESTIEILSREGMDVSSHISQRLTQQMINKSDLILVMEKAHEERILQVYPEAKNRVFLLKEFAKIEDNNLDIADPIEKSLEFYEKTYKTIKEAIERLIDII